MKEMMQAMMDMSGQSQTTKIDPFNGKQEDYPKWALKQKQMFVTADLGHVLDNSFLGKLPRRKDMELNNSSVEHKQWVRYRRQNAKRGAAIVGAQESEDVILALQEANELELTWPSRTAPNM